MRIHPRLCVLLGVVLAIAPFIAGSAPGCGGTFLNITCDEVYDPYRLAPDGTEDPCCQVQLHPETCVCAPGYGNCADAGAAATTDAAADADGGPPPADAGSDAAADAVGSAGTCGPPPHLTASAGPCPGGGDGGLVFDPPPAWDGGCTSFDQIPQGNAQSVTIDALTVTESCAPVTEDAGTIPPPTFATDVAACQALALPTCGDLLHVCATDAPLFRQCIFAPGEILCPAPWTDQTLVTTGFDDERACAPCQCGAVMGSSCTGTLAIFNDTICGMTPPPQPFAQILVGVASTKTACADVVPAGAALGSKTLLGIKYKPGTCPPSGGEPTDGGVTPTGIATFCCLP